MDYIAWLTHGLIAWLTRVLQRIYKSYPEARGGYNLGTSSLELALAGGMRGKESWEGHPGMLLQQAQAWLMCS